MMLSFYLNIILVLEKAKPSYLIDINHSDSKTRDDFIDVVFDVYPDKFEIFKHKTPHIFLKSKKEFITSSLETMNHENSGKSLGYCYTNINALDRKLVRIALSVIAYSYKNKIKTQLYAICLPATELNENIMNTIYNDINNYNQILNKYDYFVSLTNDILWPQNGNIIRNCTPNKTLNKI